MNTKAKIKWTLDVLMTAALFFLMGYQFWGETAHEWIGAGMLVLFVVHQVLNRSWYVFAFLPIRGGLMLARRLHILGSYWGYLLMSLHLGLHWGMVCRLAAKKRSPKRKYQAAGLIISLLIAAYGVRVFIRRNFLTYLFLRSEFVFLDYEEPRLKFFLDCLALMGLCIFAAHYGAKLVKRMGKT